jgi:CBS-domain-containing membrane protein
MLRVRDIMGSGLGQGDTTAEVSTPPCVVDLDAPARDAALLMAGCQTHCLVVYDDTGNVVGVVTTFDVIAAIADGQAF